MTLYYLKEADGDAMDFGPTIIFAGEHMPPTTNNLRQPGRGRGGKARIVSTDSYRTWSALVSSKLNEQANLGVIKRVEDGQKYRARFALGLWGRFSTSADMMNREKAAIDVMVKAAILPDDSVKLFRHSEFFVIEQKDNPFGEPFFMVTYRRTVFDLGDVHGMTLSNRLRFGGSVLMMVNER